MITRSVAYLNQTIRNAASAAGIKYIDIEHALDGKNMCAGSGGVTHPVHKVAYGMLTKEYLNFEDSSVVDSRNPAEDYLYKRMDVAFRDSAESLWTNHVTALMIYLTETFHPNAVGHQAIYDYIHAHQKGTSLLDDECDGAVIVCPNADNALWPSLPTEFGGVSGSFRVEIDPDVWKVKPSGANIGNDSVVERGTAVQAYLNPGRLQPVTPVKVTIHSDTVVLASASANADGSFALDTHIPGDMAAGYHMLVIEGTGFDGVGVKYIQPIFVTGPQSDIDGDGIGNAVDTCEFLTPAGADGDRDGVDDNCDSIISEVGSKLVQAGAPSFATSTDEDGGVFEHANDIYLHPRILIPNDAKEVEDISITAPTTVGVAPTSANIEATLEKLVGYVGLVVSVALLILCRIIMRQR